MFFELESGTYGYVAERSRDDIPAWAVEELNGKRLTSRRAVVRLDPVHVRAAETADRALNRLPFSQLISAILISESGL
jgi:hypothetical protein